jgi:DNA-binding SARP family transcriptional activator/predicted ATPase
MPAGGRVILATLQLFFFGPLEMRCDDQPAPRPPTLKSLSLLAYLVFHRDRPQPRERLAELYFGERTEHKALRSLSTALWHIHRCLPEESILLSDVHSVQINPLTRIWLDVEAFEALAGQTDSASLQEAVALYRGDFLEGFYDDWVISERYRLESLYLDALARLMSVQEAAGDYPSALATAYRLLSRDALREDAYQAAMRALCRLGQRKAALEQYERCRETMRNELGVQPAPETTTLYQAILDGKITPAPHPQISSEPALPSENAGRSPFDVTSTARLTGRDGEIAFLEDCWRTAQAGKGNLALISGEAGVRKTRLVEEFANHLRWQGYPVVRGNGYEFERNLPYQPIAGALRTFLLTLSIAELAGVPVWALREVARLVPELLERQPWSEPHPENVRNNQGEDPSTFSPVPGLNQAQILFFEGVARVLAETASRRPLLLILEDLHWAGESTLQLLYHLVHSFSGLQVLIVGTFRSEVVDTRHPIRALQRQLVGEGTAHQLELSCLSPVVVETIIGEMSGAGTAVIPLAKRLYQETEGNPFFLMEIIKTLFETGQIQLNEGTWQGDFARIGDARISAESFPLSRSMSEAVQARVQHLKENIQDGLHLAAVLGREFNYELLLSAWGKGEEETLELLDELLRHRLVEEKAGAEESDFAFTHHKIQEIIYQGLPRHRCSRLHAQVGAAMETIYAAEIESRVAELAHHFEQACRLEKSIGQKAIIYLMKAGQQSLKQFAYLEAITYYQRGQAILHTQPETSRRTQQEIELQLALAVPLMAMQGYTSPEVGRVYGRVRDLCQSLAETPALFDALVGLVRYYGLSGDTAAYKQILDQLIHIASKSGDRVILIEAHRCKASYLLEAGQVMEASDAYEQGLALYDPSLHLTLSSRFGHDPALTLLAYLSRALWLLGYPEQAREKKRMLIDLIQSFTHVPSQVVGYSQSAVLEYLFANPLEALVHAEAALHLSQQHGIYTWVGFATALKGWALFESEHTLDGLKLLEEGIQAWHNAGYAHSVPFLLTLQAEALGKIGKPEDGLAVIQTALSIAQRGADLYWLAELYRVQGSLLWQDGGDYSAVEALFLQAKEVAHRQGARMLELRATTNLAQLWREQGKRRK